MSCACALAGVWLAFVASSYEWSLLFAEFAERTVMMSLGSFTCRFSIGTVDARLGARDAQEPAASTTSPMSFVTAWASEKMQYNEDPLSGLEGTAHGACPFCDGALRGGVLASPLKRGLQ